ncbi:MAG: hypothetical protein PHI23_04660 [Candidatus Peribacteraceae bacterium]|nr:hypothetical protein [Candidatus Peribacteraceae bacterium]
MSNTLETDARRTDPPAEQGPAALKKIANMLPELERLARESGYGRLLTTIAYVRAAVERGLREEDQQQQSCPEGGDNRDRRLMAWAQRHHVLGTSPYFVQGSMIHMGIDWMKPEAESLLREWSKPRLSREQIQTAGFRALKGLATHFDPGKHGDDFQRWAEPLVQAAMLHCLEVEQLAIPDKPTLEELLRLRRPDADPPPPPPPPGSGTEPPPPPERSLSPEEEEEQRRRRRFCRWAKDAEGIAVEQDQFDQAVQDLAGKYHSLAGGVVDSLNIPSDFRGGKKAVRHEAQRLLPGIVRTFEPPPVGTIHFHQHVRGILARKLGEFLRNGKG